MELKPLKRIGAYEQYKLKDFKELSNGLLARLHKEWPDGATHTVFQFGDKINDEHRLAKSISHKYNVAIIYSAKPGQIKSDGPNLPKAFNEGVLSRKTLRALFDKQSKQVYKKVKKLTPAYIKEHKLAVKLLENSRHLCLYKNGRFAALYIMVQRNNYLGKKCDWGLWMWSEPFLSSRENNAMLAYWFNWMKKTRLPVELKTRSFGIAAQKFMRKHGFEPKYVTVAKIV